jgi:hypothetical protein
LAGADVTMLCSVLVRRGIAHLRVKEREMRKSMEEHEYESACFRMSGMRRGTLIVPVQNSMTHFTSELTPLPSNMFAAIGGKRAPPDFRVSQH